MLSTLTHLAAPLWQSRRQALHLTASSISSRSSLCSICERILGTADASQSFGIDGAVATRESKQQTTTCLANVYVGARSMRLSATRFAVRLHQNSPRSRDEGNVELRESNCERLTGGSQCCCACVRVYAGKNLLKKRDA